MWLGGRTRFQPQLLRSHNPLFCVGTGADAFLWLLTAAYTSCFGFFGAAGTHRKHYIFISAWPHFTSPQGSS